MSNTTALPRITQRIIGHLHDEETRTLDDKGGSDSGDSGDSGGDSHGPGKAPGEAQELRPVTAGVMGGGLLYMALMGGGVLVWVLTILTTIYTGIRFVTRMDGIDHTPSGTMRFLWQIATSPFDAVQFGDYVPLTTLIAGIAMGVVFVSGGRLIARKAIRAKKR